MAILCKLCGVRRDAVAEPGDCYGRTLGSAHEWTETGVSKEGLSSSSAGWTGIGCGSAMAMVLSFQLNHSIWYMILHGICSWIYVAYRAWEGNY